MLPIAQLTSLAVDCQGETCAGLNQTDVLRMATEGGAAIGQMVAVLSNNGWTKKNEWLMGSFWRARLLVKRVSARSGRFCSALIHQQLGGRLRNSSSSVAWTEVPEQPGPRPSAEVPYAIEVPTQTTGLRSGCSTSSVMDNG